MGKKLIKEIKYSILYRVCEDICHSILFRIRNDCSGSVFGSGSTTLRKTTSLAHKRHVMYVQTVTIDSDSTVTDHLLNFVMRLGKLGATRDVILYYR
jgi:hypothetical protein